MANMTTPLSMVITGMLLAAGDLGCIVRSKPVWKLAAVRMLLIPAVLPGGCSVCWASAA